MSYRKLEVWQLARELVIDIHRMSLTGLPKFEMYEEGSQIRRAIKSVKSNIVEGYGRRRYKQDFLRFLTYAHVGERRSSFLSGRGCRRLTCISSRISDLASWIGCARRPLQE